MVPFTIGISFIKESHVVLTFQFIALDSVPYIEERGPSSRESNILPHLILPGFATQDKRIWYLFAPPCLGQFYTPLLLLNAVTLERGLLCTGSLPPVAKGI